MEDAAGCKLIKRDLDYIYFEATSSRNYSQCYLCVPSYVLSMTQIFMRISYVFIMLINIRIPTCTLPKYKCYLVMGDISWPEMWDREV